MILEESDQGVAVSVPELPGCHSQGATREQALKNIAIAVYKYLEVVKKSGRERVLHEVTVNLTLPQLPGIYYLDAVRVLEKLGLRSVHWGRHIVMTDENRVVTIPRCNPIHAVTMGNIVRDVGLTKEAFYRLL